MNEIIEFKGKAPVVQPHIEQLHSKGPHLFKPKTLAPIFHVGIQRASHMDPLCTLEQAHSECCSPALMWN